MSALTDQFNYKLAVNTSIAEVQNNSKHYNTRGVYKIGFTETILYSKL